MSSYSTLTPADLEAYEKAARAAASVARVVEAELNAKTTVADAEDAIKTANAAKYAAHKATLDVTTISNTFICDQKDISRGISRNSRTAISNAEIIRNRAWDINDEKIADAEAKIVVAKAAINALFEAVKISVKITVETACNVAEVKALANEALAAKANYVTIYKPVLDTFAAYNRATVAH